MGLIKNLLKSAKPKSQPDRYYERDGYRFHFPVDGEDDNIIRWNVTVNVTKAGMKVRISDSEAGTYIKGCRIAEEDGNILGKQGSKTIFVVTNRSKAFKELEPFIDRDVVQFKINKAEGEHGIYYRVQSTFRVVRD